MSKPHRASKPIVGPEGATPLGQMILSGVVKTNRGYAVATAVVSPNGEITITLGNSQAFPEHVAVEHKRIAVNAALKAQGGK